MIPSLLVTDDDTAFRNVVCDAFLRRGFRVTDACDGQEALDALAHREVHLALLDVHMPRLTGLDVMRHLSTEPRRPPLVLMSADWDEESRHEAQRMQAYRMLDKPIRLHQLRDVVCHALSDLYGCAIPLITARVEPFSGTLRKHEPRLVESVVGQPNNYSDAHRIWP